MQGSLREVATQQGAATAVALAAPNGDPTAYFVGHNAALKIHSLSSGAQVVLPAPVVKHLPSEKPTIWFAPAIWNIYDQMWFESTTAHY